MPREKKESFGLELLNPDGVSSKKILEFIFDQCVEALNKHRNEDTPREFAREAIHRFGNFVTRDDILIAVVSAEWVAICRHLQIICQPRITSQADSPESAFFIAQNEVLICS